MKIALDVMGGDYAPDVNILGARRALAKYKHVERIFLVGEEEILKRSCQEHGLRDERATIVPASEVVEMHESAAKAVRRKKDSSIVKATELVKQKEADAVVSAGSTGAAVVAATLKLRLLQGVGRAGISSLIPNDYGVCQLLDAGANPEAKPEHLATYAVMGAMYAHHIMGVKEPVVGLMSNGEEEEKGTPFTKDTLSILKKMEASGKAPFKLKGYVEGRDVILSPIDVCICDGFVGNIVLKVCEGTAKGMSKWIKEGVRRSPLAVLGALLAKNAFGAVRDRMNYEKYGGSLLLGVNGVCIIAHGSSSAMAVENALRVAVEAVEQELNPHIEESLGVLSEVLNGSEENKAVIQ